MISSYIEKFQGAYAAGVPIPPWSQTGWSFLGSFVGIALLGLIDHYLLAPEHFVLFVPAFGAMAVLLFSAFKAPASQPFNAILGNSIGGLMGVLVVLVMNALGLSQILWLTGALSVSLTVVMQELTGSQHPPGGATALIFAIILPVQKQKFMYIVMPALLGAVILVVVATAMNNLSSARHYPLWWSPIKPMQGTQQNTDKKDIVGQLDQLSKKYMELDKRVQALEKPCNSKGRFALYLQKFAGAGGDIAPNPPLTDTIFSFLGSFVGISALGLFENYVSSPIWNLPVLVAAFGAMSVLVFSLAKAPLSQPMNAVLGNTIGGAVGWAVVQAMSILGCSDLTWLSAALGVSLTIVVQERSNVVHPPGGATAMLFAVTPALQELGAKFVFAPAFVGAVIIVILGVLMNNLSPKRTYPQRWWFDDKALMERMSSWRKPLESTLLPVERFGA